MIYCVINLQKFQKCKHLRLTGSLLNVLSINHVKGLHYLKVFWIILRVTRICFQDYFMEGYYALESVKHPGRFIRQLDYRMRVMQDTQSDTFRRDASFRILDGG